MIPIVSRAAPGFRSVALGIMVSTLCACAAPNQGDPPADRRGEIIAGSLDASVQLFTDRAGGAQ